MNVSLGSRYGDFIMSAEDGRALGSEIAAALRTGDDVELDFAGVRSIVSAFLNPAVGELYETFPSADVDRRVRAVNANDVQKESLEVVRENARQYYNDPEFRAARDESLDRLFA